MPFSSCTRDQEKLNDVINQVKALSKIVDELRAEVIAIKMSSSCLRSDNNPVELLDLEQFEKKDQASRKSALSKIKRYFKKRKLLKEKPELYYYQENQSDVLSPSSDKYYVENRQGAILSGRYSPAVNGLKDQFDMGTVEVIRKRKNTVPSELIEFSESQSTGESSSSSVDPMKYNSSLRTWQFNDVGEAREKGKEKGRKYLKRKKSRSKRDTKKNFKARFSRDDKYEPTSSSDFPSSQVSDDDISTDKDFLKYQRSVTFIDRRELPKMTAQRSQTSSVSVISTEDPDLDFDYRDRVKQSKDGWKVPIKSKLKNRIKRRSSSILRSRKKGKIKTVNCGTNCPYFKDVRVDNHTDQVCITTDTVNMPPLTEHRKTQTEKDVNNGRREDVSEKKALRQNRKVKSTRIAKVNSSNLESSSSDSQGLNSKRKSCCPFKKGSAKQGQHTSSNSDNGSVVSSESSDASSKHVIEKVPVVILQNSGSTSERSTDSGNGREADFEKYKKNVGMGIKKYPEDTEVIRESKMQSRSVNGPSSYNSSHVADKPSRRTSFKIGKKRTQTLLPTRKNLPDNAPGTILGNGTENFEKSQSTNMHTIYPNDPDSRGERRVHGKEVFPKNSKKERRTKVSNRKKKLGEGLESDVISVSNFTSPSERKGVTSPVDSEERMYEIKKEQIEKTKKDQRSRYDSRKYPTRINVQPHVYQASYMHQNETPFVKDSLSSYTRKSSEHIYSESALVNIKTSDNSCYNSKNEPSGNPFTDTLLFIENRPRALLDSGLRMTEISNRLYNCLHRLDHIIA